MVGRQTMLAHMEELREMMISVVVLLIVLSIGLYPLTDEVILSVEKNLLGGYAGEVIVLTPLEAVSVRIKVSILMAAIVSSPFILYQTINFFFPALRKREKKVFLTAFVASVALFAAGCAFSYFLVLPLSYRILLGFAEPIAKPMLDLGALVDLSVTMTLLSGVIFQWPLVAGLLSHLRVVSPESLSGKRRHAIFAIFVVAAIVTPDPTVVSQLMLGIPMVALYEAGILVSKTVCKKSAG